MIKIIILVVWLVFVMFGLGLAAIVKVDENTIKVTLSADQKTQIAAVETATGQKIPIVEPVYTVSVLKALKAEMVAQKVRQTAELTAAIASCDKEIARIDALLVEAGKLGVVEVKITE